MKYIEDYDFSKIKDRSDYPERLQLIRSWLGQLNFCVCKAAPRAQKRIDTNRRVKRDQHLCLNHWCNLALAWEDKINRCLEGEPLETIKGKVKVETSMPPSMKHSARYHIHQERLNKKRAKRRQKREATQEGNNNENN